MEHFNNSYGTLRRLTDNAIGQADRFGDSRIGVIDGCGHDGIATSKAADAFLMHAADLVISNFDSSGECWGSDDVDIDALIEQSGESVGNRGLGRLSGDSWTLLHRIVREITVAFALKNEPGLGHHEIEGLEAA